MARRADIASALTAAYLAGAWTEGELVRRSATALVPRPRWLRSVAREVLASYPRPPADRPRELARFVALALDPPGRARRATSGVRVVRLAPVRPAMARMRWPVPVLETAGDLGAWLGLEPGTLEWLADVRALERVVAGERLRRYGYATVPRRDGRPRVIERPKPRLKAVQRRLLDELLLWIPVHDAAHGFVRGRSARTHAALHTRQAIVLAFDLEDCFASVRAGRIFGVLRTAGYPEGVAHVLTGLCTNTVPPSVWEAIPRPAEPWRIPAHHRLGRRLATPHLPQGAPTSPALANLCAFGLDRRLTALAARFGATYSRYADDLVLSGGPLLRRAADTAAAAVAEIARDEGFHVNRAKHRMATRAGRQRVCGIVVNEHPNLARAEYDRLKALLHDAARHGPAAANRAGVPDLRAHLQGRVAWLESLNPARGARLRERLDAIVWEG
jgi:RNA-directed DNA polymerase